MKNQRTSLGKRFTKSLAEITCAGIFLGTIILGCATSGNRGGLFGSYGDLSSSEEVTERFTSYEIKPDHNYFVAGAVKDSPDAILALDNRYTLGNPKSWHPLNSQDKTLQELVENMKDKASESNAIPYGANILDHNGIDIGDWYSTTSDTIIKLENGKTFKIYAPNADFIGAGGGGGSGGGGGGGSGK